MNRVALPPGVRRGAAVTVTVDGEPVQAHLGETIAAALLAHSGLPALRTTVGGNLRGVYCGMGVCFECLVMVDGVPNTRACVTWVRNGMEIRHMAGLAATPERKESADAPGE